MRWVCYQQKAQQAVTWLQQAIPDPRLPDKGPGRSYYEGRKGDFFVSEINASMDGKPIEFQSASHDFANPNAMVVFDDDGSTGWRPGKNKSRWLHLVMNLKQPIVSAGQLKISLLFERHYVASLGRFRFSTTSNPKVTQLRREAVLQSSRQKQWNGQTERDRGKK